MSALEVAERFFKAIEAGDVETLQKIYHPDVVIWHGHDGLDRRQTGQGREENLKVVAGISHWIKGAHYDVWFREQTQSGFVQQHVLRGTAPDGQVFEMPACIICKVEDGCITRLDEYFDPAISDRLARVVGESVNNPG